MNLNKYFTLFLLLFFASCNNKSHVQILGRSSNLLHCYIMFGENEASIKYENKTLLHTGVVDTTDEHFPIPSAVIKIDSNELILKRIKYIKAKNKIKEEYSGNGYSVLLEYTIGIDENNESIYKGKFTIRNDNFKCKYEVVGYSCNL